MKPALKSLIQRTAKNHTLAGPEELAHYVAQNTPAADVAAFYRDLLVGACRTVINERRRDPRPAPPKGKPEPASPSAKLDQRRSWWRDMLASPMDVGGIEKTLGDCTLDDLELCVKDRDAAIGRLEEQVANLNQLITLMVRHGTRTVAELPEQHTWNQVTA